MGAGPSGGGNTGSDAGFFISEQAKKDKKKKEQQKINDSLAGGSDYQGDVNPPKPPKKKTPVVMPENSGDGEGSKPTPVVPVVPKPIVPVVPKPITPTEAEVSQSAATDVVEDTIETRKKKTKAKGRSATILSSATGIRSDEGLTLGKKSLLGS